MCVSAISVTTVVCFHYLNIVLRCLVVSWFSFLILFLFFFSFILLLCNTLFYKDDEIFFFILLFIFSLLVRMTFEKIKTTEESSYVIANIAENLMVIYSVAINPIFL